LCQMHLYEDVPNACSLVPDLPSDIHLIISKATQKNPDDRYQSIEELIHDLAPVARRLGLTLSGGPNHASRGTNMMGLFLFYRDDHSEMLTALLTDFTRELRKIGVELRESDFRSIG